MSSVSHSNCALIRPCSLTHDELVANSSLYLDSNLLCKITYRDTNGELKTCGLEIAKHPKASHEINQSHFLALAKAGAGASCRAALEYAAQQFINYHKKKQGKKPEKNEEDNKKQQEKNEKNKIKKEEVTCSMDIYKIENNQSVTLLHAEKCPFPDNIFRSLSFFNKYIGSNIVTIPSELKATKLYQQLSNRIHRSFHFTGVTAYVPENFDDIQKRTLIRLLIAADKQVLILEEGGTVRDPKANEINTPTNSTNITMDISSGMTLYDDVTQ